MRIYQRRTLFSWTLAILLAAAGYVIAEDPDWSDPDGWWEEGVPIIVCIDAPTGDVVNAGGVNAGECLTAWASDWDCFELEEEWYYFEDEVEAGTGQTNYHMEWTLEGLGEIDCWYGTEEYWNASQSGMDYVDTVTVTADDFDREETGEPGDQYGYDDAEASDNIKIYVTSLTITQPASLPHSLPKGGSVNLVCELGMTVPGGSYSWSKVSGPDGYTLEGADSTTATFGSDTVGSRGIKATFALNGAALTDDCVLHTCAVNGIQYKIGEGDWQAVPTGDVMYLMKGTTASFKAIVEPAGVAWPAGKPVWSGASAKQGQPDETNPVTFSTASSSYLDYKTVSAECGNTKYAKPVICTFELSKCSSSWLPMGGSEDNTTTIAATLSPTGVSRNMRFTLYDVSSEPGYCVNKPATIPGSGENSSSWKDLQFVDPQSGFTISGTNKDVATATTPANSKTVTVKSYDYGAYGKLKAEVEFTDGWQLATASGGTDEFVKIPRDDDNNDIADGWTHNTGSKTDDADVSLNNTHNGDGLTRYEEYRGVDHDNDGKSDRLNPSRKDLFVQGSGFGSGFPAFAYGNAFGEANIDVHTFVGSLLTDDRGIDVMFVVVQDTGGHIIKNAGVRDWTWATKGSSAVGNSLSYGMPKIYKKANNYYFSDRPYVDGNTRSSPGQWADPPNGRLDPVAEVEDMDDDGVPDANETDGNTSAPHDDGDSDLDGDHVVKVDGNVVFDRDLSPMDVDDDGKVELPLVTGNEYTKDQVVQHTITHEMGHAAGIDGPQNGHCNDSSCVMCKSAPNWSRDGHFCGDCRGMIRIHNN